MTGTEPQAWGTGLVDDITFVGLDVHKATVSVAVAESGRGGEVRHVGVREPPRDPGQDGGPGLANAGSSAQFLLRS